MRHRRTISGGQGRRDRPEEVAYGEPFLGFLRGFDAVLVPSLSDEQPRIAYEALSQAVPVIGSATGGICEVVESGVNGRLSPPNDIGSLAESIIWAGRNRSELREMGLRGRASVRHATHQAMHRNRHKLLREALDAHLTHPTDIDDAVLAGRETPPGFGVAGSRGCGGQRTRDDHQADAGHGRLRVHRQQFRPLVLDADPEIEVTNLDALTYAGNLANLADLAASRATAS